MAGPICYGHCFLEFRDHDSFNKHIKKVAQQRKRRNERAKFNKLKAKYERPRRA